MTNVEAVAPAELPAVAALRALSVFTADQAGAYREHFSHVAEALGSDVQTKLGQFLVAWARRGTPGLVILTGNAGTGKTAAAEAYCKALDVGLPDEDAMVTVSPGRLVAKDLSGLPNPPARAEAMRIALRSSSDGQILVCANEGVLRDAFNDLESAEGTAALEEALRRGAHANADATLTIINVNRQRPTGAALWHQLLDYVSREDIWLGCADCPFDVGGCPMRSNAQQLRRDEVREQLRTLLRLACGEAVPTLREVLAILSWAIVGNASCSLVKERNRDLGKEAFTAADGYFSRVLGGGMTATGAERSPLLTAMRHSGLGEISDLQVDGWLRDANGAPENVKVLAGYTDGAAEPPKNKRRTRLTGSKSPLDRVKTTQHEMTFFELGEMVSTDEDATRVEDGLRALVQGDELTNVSAQSLWRQRVFFEASADLGGYPRACRRLLNYGHVHELFDLAAKAATRSDTILELTELVRGLNFLVTGFASPDEGLIIPDPACLFARDPGSFRPASPSLVHGLVPIELLSITVPDEGFVTEVLDIDHVEVDLRVDDNHRLGLRIRPRMYEAIREAADYRGPVGQGVAEMNDLRGFYGRLAHAFEPASEMRVADPKSTPPGLIKITLPRFAHAAEGS
ncbi:ATP-binding protein [Mycobacterium paraense]|uniref:ATP-binding protein n=1 Tax=Mycobacterium paraense TaxID=767916 RepID=UPI000A14D904|nr:ATP-binding protein [Mycobacterium paraense]MCV7440812.1 ATP-binding protein [Mycobacterium paraense]